MDVPWPSAYTSWMKNLGFANFDLLSMLGMTCLPGMDYELRFVSSTLMVVGIVAIVGIQYCLKASALRKKLTDISGEQKMVAAHHVFDTVDIDENGTIDPEEFELCLNHIAPDKHVLTPEEITSAMVKLGAKKAILLEVSEWPKNTALISAARNGNAAVMKVLVEEGGADTQLRNSRGHTALDGLVGGANALEETRVLLSKKGE